MKYIALAFVMVTCQLVAALPAAPVPYLVVDYIQGGYPISPYQRIRREVFADPGFYPGGYGGYGGFGGGYFPGGFGESESSASSQASSQSFSGGFGGFGGDISSSQASSSASSSSEGFFGKR